MTEEIEEETPKAHPLFIEMWEQMEKNPKFTKEYFDKLEKCMERTKGLQDYLLPTDTKYILRPNELRRILYARKIKNKGREK